MCYKKSNIAIKTKVLKGTEKQYYHTAPRNYYYYYTVMDCKYKYCNVSTLIFYKNIFYKNNEAELCEILRIF